MTSSARARSAGRTVSPSALAVVRLTTSSGFVDCAAGMSAGFSQKSLNQIRKSSIIFPILGSDGAMATTHAIGPFRLDVDAEIWFRGSEPLPVGKRAVAVLRVLVDRAGAPVSKDALIDAAWSGL